MEKPHLNNKNIYVSPDTLILQVGRVLAARSLGKSDAWISTVLRGPAVESFDAPDSQYLDGAVTEAALKQLSKIGRKPPFFLAVGYYKPHLPFVAPKKYWDLYRPDEIPPASNDFPPKGAPPFAINDMFELACYEGYAHISKATEGALPEEKARILKHGYYACVSFIDAQIGVLLAELDRLKLRENTIVVIWGDHGWKLGEHRAWCKQTNYEIDTRSPLIISAPHIPTKGQSAEGIVELVDIYPTLCELAGLDVPQGLEGSSMVPLLREPERTWKIAAFSQFPRGFQGRIMGYSLRTERYRYVEWRDWIDGNWIANEIYDHLNDPDENVNIADRPENKGLVEELSRQLWGGWWKATPKQTGYTRPHIP
jgi:iduronate 2-sulfatase